MSIATRIGAMWRALMSKLNVLLGGKPTATPAPPAPPKAAGTMFQGLADVKAQSLHPPRLAGGNVSKAQARRIAQEAKKKLKPKGKTK